MPSGSLVLSVFHSPPPTGSYGLMTHWGGWVDYGTFCSWKHIYIYKKNMTDLLYALHKHSIKALSLTFPDIVNMETCYSLRLTIITGTNFNQYYSGIPPAQLVPVTSWNQCCLAREPYCVSKSECWNGQIVPLALSTKAPCGESGTPLHTAMGLG